MRNICAMFYGEMNALAELYFAKIGGCMHAGLWIWIYPWIYPWISTENLWIWIWIWMGNFISTASLGIGIGGAAEMSRPKTCGR